MKIATTTPRNQEVVFHKYLNDAGDIPILIDIITASEQILVPKPEEGTEVLIRWNSVTGKVTVPANGMDVEMLPGEYLVGYKNKKLEVVSSRYFRENFKPVKN
jgi:hypothetical protein